MNDDFILKLCRDYHITETEAKSICTDVIRRLHEMSYKMDEKKDFAITLVKTYQEFGEEACHHWGGLVYEALRKTGNKDSATDWNESGLRFDSSLQKYNKVWDKWDKEI